MLLLNCLLTSWLVRRSCSICLSLLAGSTAWEETTTSQLCRTAWGTQAPLECAPCTRL